MPAFKKHQKFFEQLTLLSLQISIIHETNTLTYFRRVAFLSVWFKMPYSFAISSYLTINFSASFRSAIFQWLKQERKMFFARQKKTSETNISTCVGGLICK